MSDSSQPLAGMTTNPDGTIAYDFAGHVHASGLDLDEGTSTTPPDDRKVRWLRADGSRGEEIFGYDPGGADPSNDAGLLSQIYPQAGGDAFWTSILYDGAGALAASLALGFIDATGN